MQNPVIQRMMQKFCRTEFQNLLKEKDKEKSTESSSARNKDEGRSKQLDQSKVIEQNKVREQNMIKSPSDTTIYTPALQRRLAPNNDQVGQYLCQPQLADGMNHVASVQVHCYDKGQASVIHQTLQPQGLPNSQMDINADISQFVDNLRIEQHPEDNVNRRKSDVAAVDLQEAQQRASRAILEAEKFRAQVEPPGNFELLEIGNGVSDDDFFHLACHIEPNLIHKIEKGEFVELEKLLPKERLGGKNDEGRLEWVQKDGGTYLVPAHKDNKIGSFRRWEQAFRAYATIYYGFQSK